MSRSDLARAFLVALPMLGAACAGDPAASPSPDDFIVLRVDSFG